MPLMSGIDQLGFHRGISHSFVFAIIFAPFLGWLISRVHSTDKLSWKNWSWLAFWSIVTHPMLDWFTIYGTQLFQPFSNYPAAIDSIFIIDPIYTLPLVAGLILCMTRDRSDRKRQRINRLTLAATTAYLLLGVVIKSHVNSVFEKSLATRNISHERLFSAPTPFNLLLWSGMAEDPEGQWIGLYSLLDDTADVRFQYIPKHREQIAPYLDQPALQRLMWFSRGYYTVTRKDSSIYFNDLRFGRSDMWLNSEGNYIFSFKLLMSDQVPDSVIDIHQLSPRLDNRTSDFTRLLQRISGDKSVELSHGALALP